MKYVLVYCVSGGLSITIDDKVFKLTGGQVVTITSGQVHSINRHSKAKAFILEFTLDFFCKNDKDIELIFHNGLFCHFAMNEVIAVNKSIMEDQLASISEELVRSGYLNETLKKEHIEFLTGNDKDHFQFFANTTKEYHWLNEQTIEANRKQTYRDDAQAELANWMRLSGNDAKKYCDGLTTAGMEINGMAGWVVRNFYDKKNVMSKSFREQGLDKVKAQVNSSGGWLLITSKDHATASLIDTGKRLQQMLLKTREKGIAIHPMTQVLEEAEYRDQVNRSVGITDAVQFILRTGYVKDYPGPVSLRRPVDRFVKV